MLNKLKKVLAYILAVTLISSLTLTTTVNAENTPTDDTTVTETTDDTDNTTQESSEKKNDTSDYVQRTENEVLATMTIAAENDKLAFYYNEEEELFAIQDKSSDYIWWSSPINADGDEIATKTMIKEIKSSMVMEYGDPSTRGTSKQRSADKSNTKIKEIENGVEVTYKFASSGITIPVQYVLGEDYLSTKVLVDKIVEENNSDSDGQLLTSISMLANFGAAGSEEEGYFVIPDGSGALINFNNGKTYLKSYSSKVYGSDVTVVPLTESPVTQQVYLPMYGIVKGDNAMVVVAESGDGNAAINASVSGQSKSSYNICSFQFTLRGMDSYYMGGEANALTVFEKNGIKNENIEVKYYPISNKEGVSYVDVAKTYRSYLETEQKVDKKTEENNTNVYIDLYGGVEKQKSVLGLPITVKNPATTFSQAKEILTELKDNGVENVIASYNDWTDAGIEGKVDYKNKASSTLGGNKDFNDLLSYAEANGVDIYPVVNNKTFISGNGYSEFQNTAIRISGSYSRILTYDRAYGVQSTLKDPLSLLSPATFEKVYSKIADSYSELNIAGVSIGEMTSALYGDYGKKEVSRDNTMHIIEDNLGKIEGSTGSVLAQTANAYAFNYVDHITNVPLASSNYDIFDEDIPFYQIVMHGLIPYSTAAINGSPDAEELVLMAIATGSNLHYDLIYQETAELKDTDYDIYFYANYKNWTEEIGKESKFINDVLKNTGDKQIVGYERSYNDIITTYEDGTEIHVDLYNGTATVNGDKEYKLADYVEVEKEAYSNGEE